MYNLIYGGIFLQTKAKYAAAHWEVSANYYDGIIENNYVRHPFICLMVLSDYANQIITGSSVIADRRHIYSIIKESVDSVDSVESEHNKELRLRKIKGKLEKLCLI